MQRGLLIVRLTPHDYLNQSLNYIATGVHWSYGDSLQAWLLEHASTHLEAMQLVMGGRISCINATQDWDQNYLDPSRPLYAYERGEFSPAEAYESADDARAAEEHISSHLFENDTWTMVQGCED